MTEVAVSEPIYKIVKGCYQLENQLNSSANPEDEPLVNIVFDGYKIEEYSINKKVIIKVTKKIDKNGFCNEYELIEKVRGHPYIIEIIDYFFLNGMHFMVMEKILYCDLFDYVSSVTVPSDKQIKNISFQLISAIEYMHSKMIAHRDVKLENIMVNRVIDIYGRIISPDKLLSGINHDDTIVSIKLIDFDLSLKINPHEKTSSWCGTPCYVFNEIIERKPNYNAFKADIYAIGVSIYSMKYSSFPCYEKSNNNSQVFYDDKDVKCKDLNDLFKKIFVSEEKRISLRQIFEHKWFNDVKYKSFCEPIEPIPIEEIDNKIIDIMTFHDYNGETVIKQIKKGGSCLENSLYMYLKKNN
jgi:serine/threonine protein kinase